jgi:trk system potassium uptake protein TrkH
MSVFSDVESLPKGILLWRSSIQWMGGMGILAFLLAVLPSADASMFTLFSAESTGPTSSAKKITPRVKDTAKIVYLIYILMTVLLAILLAVVGIAPFDAIVCSLSAISTGGFSSMNASVGSFGNVAANMLVALFTFLAGVNFSVYFLFAVKEFKSVLKDEEVRFYCLSSGIICLIMIIDLIAHHIDFFTALENSVFLSAAVVSTAGFSAVSPNIWSTTTQIIVVIFSIIGSSSGSTGGGVKGIRVLIMMKSLKNEILKMINPKVIKTVSINGKTVDDTVVSKVAKFFFIYMFILLIGSLIISFDQKDFLTCFSVILASLSNAWTAIPTNIADFHDFSVLSKSAMMFSMIAGRLEFFPLLALFTPSVWKSK